MRAHPNLVVSIFTMILTGCGGGGDGNASRSILLTGDSARTIQNGDLIEYRLQSSGSYSDGSGDAKLNGDVVRSNGDVGGLGFDSNDKPGFTYIQQTTILDSSDQNVTSTDIAAQGPDGSLLALTYDDGDCFIAEETFDSIGAPLQLPGVYFVGFAYNRTFPMVCSEGGTASYTSRLNILSTETVKVPFGSIETFKISYVIQASRKNRFQFSDGDYEESGTLWVHPGIGVVKQRATTIDNPVGVPFTTVIDLEMTGLNYDV